MTSDYYVPTKIAENPQTGGLEYFSDNKSLFTIYALRWTRASPDNPVRAHPYAPRDKAFHGQKKRAAIKPLLQDHQEGGGG